MVKGMHHYEDARVRVSDSEVITTAFVATLYFGGHLDNARHFMQMQGFVPKMLDKSQFCRRLHRLSDLLLAVLYTWKKAQGPGRRCHLPAGLFSGSRM